MARKTLFGPYGVQLILDSSEIIPDNPGDDVPALVYYHGGTATFWCATNKGEVENMGNIILLPERVTDWLWDQQSIVDNMYEEFYREYDRLHCIDNRRLNKNDKKEMDKLNQIIEILQKLNILSDSDRTWRYHSIRVFSDGSGFFQVEDKYIPDTYFSDMDGAVKAAVNLLKKTE